MSKTIDNVADYYAAISRMIELDLISPQYLTDSEIEERYLLMMLIHEFETKNSMNHIYEQR